MFFLPIDNDAVRRGRFPFLTAILILFCVGIHARHGETHERHVELLLQQAQLEQQDDRRTRAALHKVKREIEAIEQDDLIARWAFQPGTLDDLSGASRGLLTHAFVHGSWFHLLSNMLMLYLLGVPLERRFGFRRTSSLYCTGIIAGALGYWALHYGSAVSMVGASGAIAALMGAFLVFFHRSIFTFFYVILVLIYPWWGTVRAPAVLFLPLWIALEALQMVIEGAGYSDVAHSAHVGGFLAGVVVALVWKLPVFAESGVDARSPEGRAAARRSRYRDLCGILTASPNSSPALREEALLLALELGEHEAAARDFQLLVNAFAREPARLVAAYRKLRDHMPAVALPEAVLQRVHAAAASQQDHAVVLETTQKWMELARLSPELAHAMHTAAAAQDALGHPQLAAQTRSFLWSVGMRPQAATDAAARPAAAQTATGAAQAAGRRTCAAHNLVAIGACNQCQAAVCAACSKALSGLRLCRDCYGYIAAARAETKHAEANLHAFGVLWQIWGAALLAMAPLMLLLPPDYATGVEVIGGAVVGVFGAASFVFGRALAQLRPWAYWPAVIASVLLLIQAPIGSVIAALTLNILLRARGRRLLSKEYAQVRELSRELDPRFSNFTAQLMWLGGGVLGVLLIGGYAYLIGAQLQARRMPPQEDIDGSMYRQWRAGRSFHYSAELAVDEKGAPGTKLADRQYRLTLVAQAEVLAVDEQGWPSSVAYQVERAAMDGELPLECHDFGLVVRASGDVLMIGSCRREMREWAAGLLLPSARPQVDDVELFAIEPGTVELGRTWDADEKLLATVLKTAPLPFDSGNSASGMLEVLSRARCGWPSCLVLDRTLSGDIADGATADGHRSQYGSFEQNTVMYLPARPELVSFRLDEVLDYRLRSKEADDSPLLLEAHRELHREVRATGDNVVFEAIGPAATALARLR